MVKGLSKEDLLVLDGCDALAAFETARAELMAAVTLANTGLEAFEARARAAFLGMFNAVEALTTFREKVFEAYASDRNSSEAS